MRAVLVLGLESSCDETAAAVVEDGARVRSSVISSQVDVHARYGGVVPELASRHHVLNVMPVLDAALSEAGVGLGDLDGIAVTRAPGLVGALLVALQVGKALAYARGIPLVGVHHLEGHLSAVMLDGQRAPGFPHLALVVSGGHTETVHVLERGRYEHVGRTRDDAAGEAFDKVAKLLGLGYPGGAVIDRLARQGDPEAVPVPVPMPGLDQPDFSFSGLKTWMLHRVQKHGIPEGQALADLCASFQRAVVTSLVSKTRHAAGRLGLDQVQVCGGVAANSGLRQALAEAGAEDGFEVFVAPPALCTDNAAMIAVAGTYRLMAGQRAGLDLNAQANLSLADLEPVPA